MKQAGHHRTLQDVVTGPTRIENILRRHATATAYVLVVLLVALLLAVA